MQKIEDTVTWMETGEPASADVLNRPTRDLLTELEKYDLPYLIADDKGNGQDNVISQLAMTRLLTGWGSDNLPVQPDGADTMVNGIYKASDLGFGTTIDGSDGTMLVIGSKTDTPNSTAGEVSQIVFGDGKISYRYSDDADADGKPKWKGWKTIQFFSDIAQHAMPVGSTYIQFPGKPEPANLWGGTWSILINDGSFFRATGGNAAGFGAQQQQDHQLQTGAGEGQVNFRWGISSASGVFERVGSSRWDSGVDKDGRQVNYPSFRMNLQASGAPTANEMRPKNRTVRIWHRTQ